MTFCSQIFSRETFSIECVEHFSVFTFSDRNVFGVPLSVVLQRTGQPLPQSILFAINYLQRSGKKSIVIAVPYISIFTVINWPKQHRFLLVPYHFRVCVLTAQQLHVIKYAIIIMFRHPIHEDYNQIPVTELPGMVDGLHSNSNDQLYNSTLDVKV